MWGRALQHKLISIYFKDEFSRFITKIETASDYVLWICKDTCKALTNMNENLILGAVYILPENSNFFNEEEFMTQENEITSTCSDDKYVILTGDFNAGTAELKDYTQRDDFL